MNLQNPNPVAAEIGYKRLSAYCHATGVIQVQDSQQLHGIPFKARVSVRTDTTGQYDPSNEVKAVKHINEDTGTTAAPAAQQWQAAPPAQPAPAAAPAWTAAPQQQAPAQWAPPQQPAPQQAPAPTAAAPWTQQPTTQAAPAAAQPPWVQQPAAQAAPPAQPAPAAAPVATPGPTPPWAQARQ